MDNEELICPLEADFDGLPAFLQVIDFIEK